MDQATQANIPEPQAPQTNFKRAFDEVAYSFEKIVGEVRGNSNVMVAKQAVNQLQISLNQFEILLKERGFTVDSDDSIKYLYSRALGFSWTPNCDENESEITRRCV